MKHRKSNLAITGSKEDETEIQKMDE